MKNLEIYFFIVCSDLLIISYMLFITIRLIFMLITKNDKLLLSNFDY